MIVLMCYEDNNHLFKVRNNCVDGISCPICKGPVRTTQVDKRDLEKIPFHDESKQYQHKAECLSCGHNETIFHTKKEYQEVSVCPKCKGALVDVWKLRKYQNSENILNKKPSKSLSISVDMDTDKMQLKLRAIAKHVGALADEFDAIDNADIEKQKEFTVSIGTLNNKNAEDIANGLKRLSTRFEGIE
ncbi:hypothetical protein MKX57_09345 [Lysinibacillus sp. FSL M8-0216]|uniref:hypothetical protein n=1 Tax=Lysinibacillus sp. FSL M8-0216 TaxID=2921619 RepID=UPI00315AF602